VGRKRLPWFRVQASLHRLPKFRRLPAVLRGHLLTLWSLAADSEPRGRLPDLRQIAESLGVGFIANRHRIIPRVLMPLHKSGWLDKHSDGSFWVHDWDYWQSLPEDGLQPPVQPPVQPTVQPVVVSGYDSKRLTGELTTPRCTEVKEEDLRSSSLLPFDDFSQALNIPLHTESVPQQAPRKSHGKRSTSNGHGEADPRSEPLKAFVTREWQEHRGTSISACTQTADWVQFNRMLHRTIDDSAFAIGSLQASFMRFIASDSRWERSQGLGWWCGHVDRYMGNHQHKSKALARQALDSQLSTLRAVQASAPELLTESDRALLARHS